MSSKILLIIIVAILLLCEGCTHHTSNPIVTSPSIANSNEVVGNYQFIGNDGTIELGQIVETKHGMVLVPNNEQRTSCFLGFAFDIFPAYWNYRGMLHGVPYYNRGDYIGYKLQIIYNLGIPLNTWLLHTQVTTWGMEQNGESIYGSNTSSPLFFGPHEEITVEMGYHLPRYFMEGYFSTVTQLDLMILRGWLRIKIKKTNKDDAYCW